MKKLLSLMLVVIMVFSIGGTAFANEAVVYIDATKVSQSELDRIVREAQDGINTVVISWGEATAILKPIDESEPMPAFSVNDTFSLTTTQWNLIGDEYLILDNDLKVTIKYPDYLDSTTKYYWGLNAGYYTTFSLTLLRTIELWVSASDVDGDYAITAKIS